MGHKRPGFTHKTVMYLEPSRGKATAGAVIAIFIMASLAGAALVYRTEQWPEQWRPEPDVPDRAVLGAAAFLGFLALISVVTAIINGRRLLMARRVERLSNDPGLAATMPATELLPPSPRAVTIPPISVDVVTPRQLPASSRSGGSSRRSAT